MDLELELTRYTAARELIALPEAHTRQGGCAENAAGDIVASDDPTACKWCILGALQKQGADVDLAYETNDWVALTGSNDAAEGGHAFALNILDRTIERIRNKIAAKKAETP